MACIDTLTSYSSLMLCRVNVTLLQLIWLEVVFTANASRMVAKGELASCERKYNIFADC